MPSFYRPTGNGCAERVPLLGITFLRMVQQINQVLLTSIFFACLGSFFPKELLLWFVHDMYTGLSNGDRINEGRVVVRSVSVHSPANAASGAWTDL